MIYLQQKTKRDGQLLLYQYHDKEEAQLSLV